MDNLTLTEYYIAGEREKISKQTAKGKFEQKHLEKLFFLSFLSIVKTKPFYTSFSIDKLLKSVLSASMILCGTKSKIIISQISGTKIIYDDKSALEFLIFFIIGSFAEQSGTFVNVNAKIGKELVIKFVSDKNIIIPNEINIILKKLNFKTTVFNGKKTALILKKQIVSKKECAVYVKNNYEYIFEPFSVAYICLRNVCVNPIINNTFGNLNTVNGS